MSLRKLAGAIVAGALSVFGSIAPVSAAPLLPSVSDSSTTEQILEARTDAEPTDDGTLGTMQAPVELEDPAETVVLDKWEAESGQSATVDSVEGTAVGMEQTEDAVAGEPAIGQFSTDLECQPAKIFAVTSSGKVFSVDENGESGTQAFDGWSKLYSDWTPLSSDPETPVRSGG